MLMTYKDLYVVSFKKLFEHLRRVQQSHYIAYITNTQCRQKLVLFIIFLMTMSQLAITIYLPSMPALVKSFHTGHAAIQLSLTVFLIAYGFSQFIYGPLSDIYGRRVIILIGLMIFLIGTLGCIFANNTTIFLISRIIQGLGIGCGDTMGRAILCDRFDNKAFIKAAATIGMAATITPFVGPLVGGYLEVYFNWHFSFIIMLLYALIILISIFYYFPESKPLDQFVEVDFKNIIHSYQFIFRNRVFLGFFVPGLVCFVGEMLYNIVSPFLIVQQLHLSAITFGWLTLFTIVGLFIGTLITRFTSHYFKHDAMVFYGMCILIIAGFVMIVPSLFHYLSIYTIVLPMMLFMVGVGIIYPNTNMGALTPFTANAGVAGALQGGLQMLIGGVITSHMSTLSVKSALPLGCFLFLISLVGMMIFYCFIIKNKVQTD